MLFTTCHLEEEKGGVFKEVCEKRKFTPWTILSIVFASIAVISLILYIAIELYQRRLRRQAAAQSPLQDPFNPQPQVSQISNSMYPPPTDMFTRLVPDLYSSSGTLRNQSTPDMTAYSSSQHRMQQNTKEAFLSRDNGSFSDASTVRGDDTKKGDIIPVPTLRPNFEGPNWSSVDRPPAPVPRAGSLNPDHTYSIQASNGAQGANLHPVGNFEGAFVEVPLPQRAISPPIHKIT